MNISTGVETENVLLTQSIRNTRHKYEIIKPFSMHIIPGGSKRSKS